MKTVDLAYKAIAAGVRVFWNAFSLSNGKKKKPQIAFMSRQYNRPFDFVILEPALKRRFPEYKIVWACKREGWMINPIQAIRHIKLAATSRICIVDCYIPGICMPKSHEGSLYVQIWHAIGAIKKFGYQSAGTKQGRSLKLAYGFSMHRGYDVVIAGLPGFIPAISDAFRIDASKVFAVGTPRIDFFLSDLFSDRRAERAMRFRNRHGIQWAGPDVFVILYVPTFRRIKRGDGDSIIKNTNRLIERLAAACDKRSEFRLVISLHSKQEHMETISLSASERLRSLNVTMAEANSIDAMLISDAIITDYSAIAFEAALLGKPVYFLANDYDEYRVSPGLNIDPFVEFPSISFDDPAKVVDKIEADLRGLQSYEECGFMSFIEDYRGNVSSGSVERVCDVIESELQSQ